MLAKTEFTTLETNTVYVQLDAISYELSPVTWFHYQQYRHCPSKVMEQHHETHTTPRHENGPNYVPPLKGSKTT